MSDEPTVTEKVTLAIPASTRYVPTLRLVAASLAAHSELTVEDIEDLRLAVDEAAALVIPHAKQDHQLQATFTLAPRLLTAQLRVRAEVSDDATDAHLEKLIDREGYAWMLLHALAAAVHVEAADGVLCVSLTLARADGP